MHGETLKFVKAYFLFSVMSQLKHFHICMSRPFIIHFNIVAHQRADFVIGPFTSAAITVPRAACSADFIGLELVVVESTS